MNIILGHNYYGSSAPSGENMVFDAEALLLRQHGHTLIELVRHSDEIRNQGVWGYLRGALSTPWNPFSKWATEKLSRTMAPDIFHVHNTFPLLSPSVFYAANNSRTATVLTLHNFRTFCAAGIPMREGQPCTECLDKQSIGPALRHKCYRGYIFATAPLAAMIWLHRTLKTWEKQVDAFIALTEFQKNILCNAGLPSARVFVKPHFYPAPPEPLPWLERAHKIVFVGRLSVEKGCHVLIKTWELWGRDAPHLEIIGDGPERTKLENSVVAAGLSEKIIFHGQLSFKDTQARLSTARLLVTPSLCFEGFPMVIREAFALGVPVVASKLGSMPYVIAEERTGTLFQPGDAKDLLDKIIGVWSDSQRLSAWGKGARETFLQKYTADANYKKLIQIYQLAIEHRNRKHI